MKNKKLTAQVKALPVQNTESVYAKIKQMVNRDKQRKDKSKEDDLTVE